MKATVNYHVKRHESDQHGWCEEWQLIREVRSDVGNILVEYEVAGSFRDEDEARLFGAFIVSHGGPNLQVKT